MKNNHVIFVIVCILIVFGGGIQAKEKTSSGFKFGLNVAMVDGDVEEYVGTPGSRQCISIGGFASMHQFGNVYLQPEILYAEKGAVAKKPSNEDMTLKLSYIEIPVLFKYKFNNHKKLGFSLYTGPAVDLLLSSELDNTDTKSYTIKFDAAAVVGGSITIASGSGYFILDTRYTHGFPQIDDWTEDLNIKNRVFSVLVGYGFGK